MSKKNIEKEIKKYEDHNDLSFKLRQQARIAQFVEEFDADVKLWKSGGANMNLIRGHLGLPRKSDRKQPELDYPESHFTIVHKPVRVHHRVKRGPVDMDEEPGKKKVPFLKLVVANQVT
jgi:hypothetical protein